jgi:hypothetical protein
MSKIITRLSVEADASICGWCGAQDTERTAELWPGRPWVDKPERRSSNRTAFSDVPTATSNGELVCEDRECVYGVQSSLKLWTGTMLAGCRAESFRVPSCEVVRIVEGVGSNGYIDTEVIA